MKRWLKAAGLTAAMATAAVRADEPFVFRDIAGPTGLADLLKGGWCHAAAWGDADGDGKLDLFVGTFADKTKDDPNAVPNAFLWNAGGKFAADATPAIHSTGRGTGAVLVDLDNDGLLDLYVSNHTRTTADATTAGGRRNLLYRALPGRKWEDVSERSGAVLNDFTGRNVAVLDYDGDGLLDLFVVHASIRGSKAGSVLLHNLGNFKFEVANEKAGLPNDIAGLGAAVADLTGDGWPSIFVGGTNRLFVAQGNGKFREATELKSMFDWGAYSEDDAPSAGVAFGDIDHDGRPDLVIGQHNKRPWGKPVPIRLFRNEGVTRDKAQFAEMTQKAGLAPIPMKAPHVELRDFDNDGWPDLYSAIVVFKDDRVYPVIYHNEKAAAGAIPKFTETAFIHRPDFPDAGDRSPKGGTAGFYDKLLKEHKITYMATGPSGDFDGDGRLDLFLASWFPEQPSMLLRNESKAGNWLAVSVIGSADAKVNRMGIGAKVKAYQPGKAGDPAALVAWEEISTGYGYTCGQPSVAHLGLGILDRCDLIIELPHGRGVVRKNAVAANQVLAVPAQ